jgi:hypothetical protein
MLSPEAKAKLQVKEGFENRRRLIKSEAKEKRREGSEEVVTRP